MNIQNYANEVNYIVSTLPDYVKENTELISNQLAFGTPTIKRVTPQTGVKTSARINFLGLNVPIQDGKGCATGYSGTATITDREIKTAILEKKIKICPDTLLGKWPEYLVRIPADKRESLPFEAFLIAELVKDANDQLETLVWQGKTTTYSGTDLIDGYLTLVGAAATHIAVSIPDGSSAWKAVKMVIMAAPARVLRTGKFKVFVAPEFFNALALEMVEKNLYHFNPGAPVESLVFPGTSVEVISTAGLSGSEKIFGATLDNMYYGTDESGAESRVKVGYNEENGYFWADMRWNSGVNVAFPDRCVIGSYDEDEIVSPDNDATLAGIKAALDAQGADIETLATQVSGLNADAKVFKTKEQ